MRARTGFKYAGFGVLGVAAVFGFTFVVMWLWNWLVPEMFNGPVLGYWQTLGTAGPLQDPLFRDRWGRQQKG